MPALLKKLRSPVEKAVEILLRMRQNSHAQEAPEFLSGTKTQDFRTLGRSGKIQSKVICMFTCKVPDEAGIRRLTKIEHHLFDGVSLSKERIREIHEFCPEMFCVIENEDANIVGYSTIFTMAPEQALHFISGSISEPDLSPELLITPSDDNFSKTHAYIGSVVVTGDFNVITRSVLLSSLLSWRMTQMTRLALRRLPVFMIAASENGSQLIRFVGARILKEAAEREDGAPVYGRTITPSFMNRANKALQRCLSSGFVKMDYSGCSRSCADS
ncbi:hypothetical protein [Methylocystis heyeri]|uniref:Uncharacterized protein n=1 Tax=Methylocystis heyeri TaxID=391905 RepID=A0A6B8KDN9_9HYPH|nr:hypothetical protein [Methylocystis heyeri]QGM44668.1 hypothetical protein H2LOC_002615 [Methylocystis heyeri]